MSFLHTFSFPRTAILDADFLLNRPTQALMKPSFIGAEKADIDLVDIFWGFLGLGFLFAKCIVHFITSSSQAAMKEPSQIPHQLFFVDHLAPCLSFMQKLCTFQLR